MILKTSYINILLVLILLLLTIIAIQGENNCLKHCLKHCLKDKNNLKNIRREGITGIVIDSYELPEQEVIVSP